MSIIQIDTIKIDVSEAKSPNSIVAAVVKNMKQHIPYMDTDALINIVEECYQQFFENKYYKYEVVMTFIGSKCKEQERFVRVKTIPKQYSKSLDWFDYVCKRALNEEVFHPGAYRQAIVAYLFDCLLKDEGLPNEIRTK